ncbi:MAG TPA: ADP-ribosylglycohydrolase family protein [Anaerovoracaceae bacterium]|nr:ADP-ribosylglycohydrolase family protein [Anaerovoracaceae bacterium]
MISDRYLVLSGIMGHVVGDALGLPVEFRERHELMEDPVIDMREYGTYNQPKGTWSDDTAMTLCLMDSLKNGINYYDIMENFKKWFEKGEYTPHNEAFDIGNATQRAIVRYISGSEPLECGGKSYRDNGNGALMRILPLCYFLKDYELKETQIIVTNIASLTHNHDRSHIACLIYILIGINLINGNDLKNSINDSLKKVCELYIGNKELSKYSRLMEQNFFSLSINDVKSTGYVVDTLEAVIWCLVNTDSYKSAILKAVNLGDDTDTVGAITGGLAGIYYGYDAIPEDWVNSLVKKEYLIMKCENLAKI